MLHSNTNTTTKKEQGSMSELLQSQTNAENQSSLDYGNENAELYKRTHIEDSPFQIIELTEKMENGRMKAFVAMGDKRLTNYMTVEEAHGKVKERDWDLIGCIVS